VGGDCDQRGGGEREGEGAVIKVRALAGLGDAAAGALGLHIVVFLALANVDITDHTSRYVLSRFSPQVATRRHAPSAAAAARVCSYLPLGCCCVHFRHAAPPAFSIRWICSVRP